MNEKEWLYQELKRRSNYAINSKSRNLVYETFGAAKMAFCLEAITREQFFSLNDLLIKDTLNNAAVMNAWDRENPYGY